MLVGCIDGDAEGDEDAVGVELGAADGDVDGNKLGLPVG